MKYFIIIATILMLFSCKNNSDEARSMNQPNKPVSELKESALSHGDTNAYETLETAYLDYTDKSFIPIAKEMAEKHNYPKAFHDVYWKMTSSEGLNEEEPIEKWLEWSDNSRSEAIDFLIQGAKRDHIHSINALKKFYSEGKPLHILISKDSSLLNRHHPFLIDLEIINSSFK